MNPLPIRPVSHPVKKNNPMGPAPLTCFPPVPAASRRRAPWMQWCAVGCVALVACSCSALDNHTARRDADPFLEAVPSVAAVAVRPMKTDEPAGFVKLSAPPPPEIVQTAAFEDTAIENTGEPAVDEAPPAAESRPNPAPAVGRPARGPVGTAIERCPPEDRLPATADDASAAASQAELARMFPDEYLFDGGDRGLPLHTSTVGLRGFETEDTLVQYRDDEGQRHLKPSNQVAVYSPRFSAVSTVSAPAEGVSVGRLASNNRTIQGDGLRARQTTSNHEQREGTERYVMRSRVSGLEMGAGQHFLTSPAVPAVNAQTLRTADVETFLHSGHVTRTEEARLAEGMQSAIAWTRTQNPVIAVKLESAGQTISKSNTFEYVGLELEDRKIGDLRIVKLADKKVAAPGEIVTFTIRYDNLGDREVSDVTIVDNLTPRLQYVADSGTSDRDGQLDTSDNAEGSVVLQWTFDQPLPGRSGGVVTFQARVK